MFNRTLVALKCGGESNFSVAKFVGCLVHHFDMTNAADNNTSVSAAVKCQLEDNLLKLSFPDTDNKCSSTGTATVELQHSTDINTHHVFLHHSPECPIANLTEDDMRSMPPEVKDRGVDVAVSVLIESKDSRILMTKRPEHMRTFPRAWVPPGGHIETKETLIEAGLRELREETGLTLNGDTRVKVLCLWESVYPVLLGLGTPLRHHVVVYVLAHSTRTSNELQQAIQLDPEEVQACAWLTPEAVKFLVEGGAGGEVTPPSQDMLVLQPGGDLIQSQLDLKTMFHPSLWGKGQQNYSGSQLALRCWLNSLSPAACAKL